MAKIKAPAVPPSLASAIRAARTRLGMTQAELATALRVSQNIVGRLESGGRSDPRLSTVIRLTKILGISIDALTASAGLTARARSRQELKSELMAVARQARSARHALDEMQGALSRLEALASPDRLVSRPGAAKKARNRD